MSDPSDTSPERRAIIAGVAAGLAVTATGTAQAQNAGPLNQAAAPPPPNGLRDPTDKYPKPPFPAQQQPWPGLDQGRAHDPDQGAGQAARQAGHSRQRRGTRPGLDAVAGYRRAANREAAQFGAETPLGRAGQPAELASLYVLLASDEASYSTGQVFGAVGGCGGP